MMKIQKIVYWVATGIMCAIFSFSIFNYFANHDMISGFFTSFGFPTWLIYPMAVAKILGIVAVLSKISPFLKEWAYAGFFFNAILAFAAHQMAQDGGGMFSIVAILAIIVSRYLDGKLFGKTRGAQAY